MCEEIQKGRRKALIVQATGTGKTRVAMAIIDKLRRAHVAKKILFLTDRTALCNQAMNKGFKEFFKEDTKVRIYAGKVDKNKELYVSTIQTLMECYPEFSPGDFDVIISDEAHRSIYNKWKDVFTYFDAIQIGLTATPTDILEKDTFRFFECEDNTPTALYTYEQAVDEKYLVRFEVQASSTYLQIKGIKPSDIPEEIKDKLAQEGIYENSLFFEGTDIEKKVAVKGTNEAIVREVMENGLSDITGTLPAKTIIFAVSKNHAKRLYEAFEKLYPEYKGKLAEIITSDNSGAQKILDKFEKESFPRIAISVDMLDTGVDIPEVCNLVFAKPVFSKTKFWQMIGRGTRNNDTCKHPKWLPNGKKEIFIIFDFFKNMDYFNMHPKGRESNPSEAISSKIFLMRLQQYEYFLNIKDKENIERLKKLLIQDVDELPKKTIAIKERLREIELVTSEKLWQRIGKEPSEFLKIKIAPLIKYKQNINYDVSSFTLKLERLALAVLHKDKTTIERLKEDLADIGDFLSDSIREVKEKRGLLDKMQDSFFWDNLMFEDVQTLKEEIGPLLIYKRKDSIVKIELDIDDFVKQRRLVEFGPQASQEYIEVYKDKVEKKILQIAEEHPTLQKIKENKYLTTNDLEKLEKTLNSPELYITEETLKKVYESHEGTLVEFMKKILGLYQLPDYKQQIEESFKTFIIELNEKKVLSADQINFLRSLQTVFLAKQHIEYRDFFEPPLTNIESAPLPLFDKEQLQELLQFCTTLEKQKKIRGD